MTDRDAMLRAIAANPDDDTPRLIYADLLDELGSDANAARARFIRTQIDLARNPGRSWFANSDRLCEVARLVGQFSDKWLDELPKWAATEARKQKMGPDDFPRGFIDAFHFKPGTFTSLGGQLLDVAPVTRIVTTGLTSRTEINALLVSPFLLLVRSLGVLSSAGDLTASLVKTSNVLASLGELDLSSSALTDAGAVSLAQAGTLGSLHTLTAHGNRLTVTGATLLLSTPKLPKLRRLDIRGASDGYRWVRGLRLRFQKHTILV